MAIESKDKEATPQGIAPYCPVCLTPWSIVYDPELECDCWVCPNPDCNFIMPILD